MFSYLLFNLLFPCWLYCLLYFDMCLCIFLFRRFICLFFVFKFFDFLLSKYELWSLLFLSFAFADALFSTNCFRMGRCLLKWMLLQVFVCMFVYGLFTIFLLFTFVGWHEVLSLVDEVMILVFATIFLFYYLPVRFLVFLVFITLNIFYFISICSFFALSLYKNNT